MRIFLAATTTAMNKEDRAETFTQYKPKYFLETFFAGETICKRVLADCGDVENFLLDSGAFSYMSGAPCSKEQMEAYCDRYIRFIKENNIKYFFELDVDTIFGIEFVEKLRKKIEQETGRKPIPVWHKGRGIEYWKKMCVEYDYVAIGGLVFHVKQSEWELIKKMVLYARQRGVKVHGLGFTKTKLLPDYAFYSVDSASWSKSAALGQNKQKFNGEYMEQKRIDGQGKKIKLSKLASHNMCEWVKYQRYMDRKAW